MTSGTLTLETGVHLCYSMVLINCEETQLFGALLVCVNFKEWFSPPTTSVLG